MTNIPYKEEVAGSYDLVSPKTQERIMALMCVLYVRNGLKHPDGSLGEVRCSPGFLRDALAYILLPSAEDMAATPELKSIAAHQCPSCGIRYGYHLAGCATLKDGMGEKP